MSTQELETPEREEHAKLRRVLGRWDTVFFLISAMVVVDTIGAIAVGGGQVFTWLIVLLVFFFVPSALASAELGAAIPAEGGAYVWVRRAFGPYAGALTSWFYWASTPLWLGGSVAALAMTVYVQFIGPLTHLQMFGFGAGFIAAATLAAVLPLHWGKWIPTSGALGQIALLLFFTLSVIAYGFDHGVHGIHLSDLAPTAPVFIAVVPIMLFSFVGVELPTTAGEEMRDPQRDIPAAIARAGIGLPLMYGLPILAVLVVLPTEQITSLHGLIDAMESVFTVYGGSIGPGEAVTLSGAGLWLGRLWAVVLIWVLMASGSAWIMGAGRAQAAACLDGAGPRRFGTISERTGVPVIMGLVSGAVSLVTMAVNLTITGVNGQKYFSVALTTAIAVFVLAYLLIFPAFVALRLREPDLERPFRAPGGLRGAWVITALASAWAVLGVVCLLWPGVGTPDPDGALPAGFEGQRVLFEVLVLVPILGVVALTTLFFVAGRLRRARVAVLDRS